MGKQHTILRTFDSLTIYNYRLFWFGQLISLSGTWMQTTAQAWLVLKLTNSPVALGTVILLQFLPITLLTVFGGVLADKFPKRTMLLFTQSTATVQALVLAGLVLTNTIQLWEVYSLAFLLGLVNAFDTPTRQAFVSELVGKDHLPNAIALNSTLFNAARVVGPSIGGIVISVFGIGQAFLLNGISFLPVIAGLAFMHPQDFFAVPQPQHGNIFRQVSEGFQYSIKTPKIFLIMLVMAVVGTFGYNYNTILPLIARYVLHSDAKGLGILTSAVGVGSLIAALIFASARRTSQSVLLGSALIFSIMLLLAGLSSWMPLTLLLLGFMGATGIIFTATANTGLQMNSPSELRGRVMSIYILLFAGTTPIGGYLVGYLSEHIGVQPTITLMGGICITGVLLAIGYAWHTHAGSKNLAGQESPEIPAQNNVVPVD